MEMHEILDELRRIQEIVDQARPWASLVGRCRCQPCVWVPEGSIFVLTPGLDTESYYGEVLRTVVATSATFTEARRLLQMEDAPEAEVAAVLVYQADRLTAAPGTNRIPQGVCGLVLNQS